MVAVLGLYEPFTHERTIVDWCVSGDGVAMLSPLWVRYGNYYSVPCHEVLVQTRIRWFNFKSTTITGLLFGIKH